MADKVKRKAPPRGVNVHVHVAGERKKGKAPGAAASAADKTRADLFEALAAFKRTLRPGSGFEVRLWRYNDAARDDEYMPPIAVDDFKGIETVRQLYGGGKYTVRFADESGKFVSVEGGGRWEFRIAGAPKGLDGAAPGAGVTGIDVQLAELRAELRALVAAKPATTGDPGATAVQLATALGASMTAGMTAAMTMMKGAGGGGGLEQIETILDLAERLSNRGAGNGAEPHDPMALALLGLGQRALERIDEAKRAPTPGQRALPAPAAAEGGAPPNAEGTDMQLAALKPMITSLVELAKDDSDPEVYAPVLLDRLRKFPAVLSYLDGCRSVEQRAQLEQQLDAAFPETVPYPGWFRELWAEVWAILDEPDEPPQSAPARAPRAPRVAKPATEKAP